MRFPSWRAKRGDYDDAVPRFRRYETMEKEDDRFAYDEEENNQESHEEEKENNCLLSRWGMAAFIQTHIA